MANNKQIKHPLFYIIEEWIVKLVVGAVNGKI